MAAPRRLRAARAERRRPGRWQGLRRALADLDAGLGSLLGPEGSRPPLVAALMGERAEPPGPVLPAPRGRRPAPARRPVRPGRACGRGHLALVK